MPEVPPRAWERQPGEPEGAWAAFCIYRDDGPGGRALSIVATNTGVRHPQSIQRMSSRWHWVERVQAWDAEVDRRRREAHLAEVEEMRKRHVQMAIALQGAAGLALAKYVAVERAPLVDAEGKAVVGKDGRPVLAPPSLKPNEAATFADLGTKLERLNKGEPETIEERRHTIGASSFTGEDGPIAELVVRFVKPGER